MCTAHKPTHAHTGTSLNPAPVASQTIATPVTHVADQTRGRVAKVVH